ncbi:MAG: helix-turn-helix domain-containing protein [Thiolinea sp.]
MTDIPHYVLYGEENVSDPLNYFHIAALEQSLPKHNWEIHPHRHDNMHQLLIVTHGTVSTQINDQSRDEPGPCMLSIPPKEVHGFVHQANVRGYILTIAQPFLLGLFDDAERELFNQIFKDALVTRPSPDSYDTWQLEQLMPQLLNEFQTSNTGKSSMIGAYLKMLFILLYRSLKPEQKKPAAQDVRVSGYEQFTTLLEKHYREHWTLNQYADALNLSPGQLNRLCQHYTDQNALKIIHERVLTEAKRQLIYTQLSAKAVSYKLGFKDPGYFSRFFQRHVGMPPGKFKKQIREQRRQSQ